jgi:seryl-tRNA synthetase
MFDIKAIRENPDAFDDAWASRGLPPQTETILEFDSQRRILLSELQVLQRTRNQIAQTIGRSIKDIRTRPDLPPNDHPQHSVEISLRDARIRQLEEEGRNNSADLKKQISNLEEQDRELSERLRDLLSSLPNVPLDEVPEWNRTMARST